VSRIELPIQLLHGPRPLAPESVHGIRKQLKRARAGLRLLRGAVGDDAYAQENRRLRDAARPLAALRDADVGVETIDALLKKKRFRPHRRALLRARAELRGEGAVARDGFDLAPLAAALDECSARVAYWRLPYDPRPVLSAGFKRVYRRGRSALSHAREVGSDASLHELRKQVKYLGAAARLFEGAPPGTADAVSGRADAIAERLGEDHDLAVLRPRFGRQERELLRLIDRRRHKLQKKALRKAKRLYRRKPRRFVALLG
jgi:CHAD domain-containing protein